MLQIRRRHEVVAASDRAWEIELGIGEFTFWCLYLDAVERAALEHEDVGLPGVLKRAELPCSVLEAPQLLRQKKCRFSAR